MINEFSVVAKLSDSKMNNSCWQVYPSRKWKCLGKVPLIMIPTRNTTNEKVNTVCNIQGNLKKTLEQNPKDRSGSVKTTKYNNKSSGWFCLQPTILFIFLKKKSVSILKRI